jgi:hypothetical protein
MHNTVHASGVEHVTEHFTTVEMLLVACSSAVYMAHDSSILNNSSQCDTLAAHYTNVPASASNGHKVTRAFTVVCC